MRAILNKQTEKAVNITFQCWIYERVSVVKNVWVPKSQISISSETDGYIEFMPNNNWIMTAKAKEYFQKIAELGYSMSEEVKLFISPIGRSCAIEDCFV